MYVKIIFLWIVQEAFLQLVLSQRSIGGFDDNIGTNPGTHIVISVRIVIIGFCRQMG